MTPPRCPEIALLGIIAIPMSGTKFEWDARNMKFTNNTEANQDLRQPYRSGWAV